MITGFNHLTIGVSDLERSFDFYVNLLRFKPEGRWDKGAYLRAGELWLCLSHDESKPANDYTHYAFSVAEVNFKAEVARLQEADVDCWKSNSSEGSSYYFRDPDGHKLEIHSGDLATRLNSIRSKPYAGWSYPK